MNKDLVNKQIFIIDSNGIDATSGLKRGKPSSDGEDDNHALKMDENGHDVIHHEVADHRIMIHVDLVQTA